MNRYSLTLGKSDMIETFSARPNRAGTAATKEHYVILLTSSLH